MAACTAMTSFQHQWQLSTMLGMKYLGLIYLYIYILYCIYTDISFYMYVCMYVSIYLSSYLSSYLSICLSIDLSIYLYLSIVIYLSLSIIIYLSIYLHGCMFFLSGRERMWVSDLFAEERCTLILFAICLSGVRASASFNQPNLPNRAFDVL